jgi:hypothetical protein
VPDDTPAVPTTTRRELLKRGAFVAPAILTMTAIPSFARAGSGGGSSDGDDDLPWWWWWIRRWLGH